MQIKITRKPYVLFLIFLFLRCGQTNSNRPSLQEEEVQEREGSFLVLFKNLNQNLLRQPSGSGQLTLENDRLTVTFNIFDVAQSYHIQAIHLGENCPDESADFNKDGFIDLTETIAFSGSPFLPLDQDLSQQFLGLIFPYGEQYFYQQSASYPSLLLDLRSDDSDENNFFVKLDQSEWLLLPNRVVVIYGVPESEVLPSTIRTIQGVEIHQGIPILCGEINYI